MKIEAIYDQREFGASVNSSSPTFKFETYQDVKNQYLLPMKLISFLIILLVCSNAVAQDTIYYTQDWERLEGSAGHYYYGFKDYDEDSVGLATYYKASGVLYTTHNEVKNLREGYCVWYHDNGAIATTGNYENDEPVGFIVYYNKKGESTQDEFYVKGVRKFERGWGGHFKDTVYLHGEVTPIYGRKKTRDKGQKAFLKKLSKAVIYPRVAEVQNLEGRVFLRMRIKADGTWDDLHYLGEKRKFLTRAAMEGLHKIQDKWTPATIDGKPIDCYFTFPVMFRLK
jgi:hypothetical protein